MPFEVNSEIEEVLKRTDIIGRGTESILGPIDLFLFGTYLSNLRAMSVTRMCVGVRRSTFE